MYWPEREEGRRRKREAGGLRRKKKRNEEKEKKRKEKEDFPLPKSSRKLRKIGLDPNKFGKKSWRAL